MNEDSDHINQNSGSTRINRFNQSSDLSISIPFSSIFNQNSNKCNQTLSNEDKMFKTSQTNFIFVVLFFISMNKVTFILFIPL